MRAFYTNWDLICLAPTSARATSLKAGPYVDRGEIMGKYLTQRRVYRNSPHNFIQPYTFRPSSSSKTDNVYVQLA